MRTFVRLTTLCLAMATCTALFGDKITLKNGQEIDCRIISETSTAFYVRVSSGKTQTIPKNQIDGVERGTGVPARPGGTAPVVPLKMPVLPTLAETMTGLVDKLAGSSAAGAIAQVAGNRVYVTLGTSHGIKVGDELEVVRKVEPVLDPATQTKIGENRDVAGRLKVDNVQEKMSICSIVDGSAEQKNAEGAVNQVLRAAAGGPTEVAIGQIRVDPGSAVTEDAVVQALIEACQTSGKFAIQGQAQNAPYTLDVVARPALDGSTLVAVALTDAGTGKRLTWTQAYHKTGLSLAELGFRSALVAELGAPLNKAPVRKSLEEKFVTVYDADEGLFVPRAGPAGEVAWILPQGRLVAAAKGSLSDEKQSAQLTVTWNNVALAIGEVTAAVPKDTAGLREILNQSAVIYTENAEQFQQIYLAQVPANVSGWVLNWPDAKASWSRVVKAPSWWGRQGAIMIDGANVLAQDDKEFTSASLQQVKFGEHTFSTNRGIGDAMWIVAFFPTPNGRVTLYDKSGTSVATRATLSQPLTALTVPIPQVPAAASGDSNKPSP